MSPEVQKAIDDKAVLSVRLVECQKEMQALNARVKGRHLPQPEYLRILARQKSIKDEMAQHHGRIIELKAIMSKGFRKDVSTHPDGSYRDRLAERLDRIEKTLTGISDVLEAYFSNPEGQNPFAGEEKEQP